ncbi:MAG: sporulation protein YunB [Clostridia bacterium]|nr:sporulation protein YunB [Clostridia bacterium]
MRLHKKRRLRRRKNKKGIILFTLAIALLLVITVEVRMKPIVRVYAENIVNRLCYESINVAAAEAVESSGVGYADIVHIERDDNNVVTAVMADVAAVNKIKTGVTQGLLNALQSVENEEIQVPMGTLFGNSVFVGKGPDISVSIKLTGSSEVEVRSEFESVGINQTRHSVTMDVRCIVYVVMLGRETMNEITLSVPIAETIIIGTVPDTYLSLS